MGELAKQDEQKPFVAIGGDGVQLSSVESLYRFSQYVHKSGLCPASLKTVEQVAIAIETGLEAGLKPMMALRGIYIVNGRPSWMTETAKALVNNSGKLAWIRNGYSGEGDARHAWVESKRVGEPEPHKTMFGVADAKRAGLWGKAGPWKDYPDRMMYHRALSWNLRDNFSDVLLGLPLSDEAEDFKQPPPRTVELETVRTVSPDPLMAALASAPVADDTEKEPPTDTCGPPERWERAVITLSEKCECEYSAAKTRLERFAASVLKRKLEELDDAALGDIESKIASGDIAVEKD